LADRERAASAADTVAIPDPISNNFRNNFLKTTYKLQVRLSAKRAMGIIFGILRQHPLPETSMKRLLLLGAALALLAGPASAQSADKILNASYDVARELFEDVNAAFVPKYKADTGKDVTVDQSHAGTSKQARAIVEGLEADVVTFNQVTDIDFLVKNGFVSDDWQADFASNASPFYSLPSFLVRAGNPKNVKDWSDLVRDDVQVIFPNPKTSGNARYTYLAATAYAREAFNGDEAKVKEFVTKLFDNVPVFDTGGRAATTTFVEREIGDVLITFESETTGIRKEFGEDKFETVTPSVSLLAEFPVAIVDKVVDKRGSRDLAKGYLDFLYTPEGQKIAAENGNRVRDETVAAEFKATFPEVRLVTVEDVFGGWPKVQEEHFASGGLLDQIYGER
jgi:sulfate transport system substrate-binding protein